MSICERWCTSCSSIIISRRHPDSARPGESIISIRRVSHVSGASRRSVTKRAADVSSHGSHVDWSRGSIAASSQSHPSSRKALAKVSGISERYIAQLESGKGNVSIVLLRRVSNAMGAHLEDLIPATEPSPD